MRSSNCRRTTWSSARPSSTRWAGGPPAEGRAMRFMIIERYRDGDAVPVYRRFRDHGRLAPEGLTYVASWVDEPMAVCYQVMEADDRSLVDAWIARWDDLVDFEVIPVMTSAEAAARIAPRLDAADPDGPA